jgi:hypothetical protein
VRLGTTSRSIARAFEFAGVVGVPPARPPASRNGIGIERRARGLRPTPLASSKDKREGMPVPTWARPRLVALAPSVSAPHGRECEHRIMAAWSDEPRRHDSGLRAALHRVRGCAERRSSTRLAGLPVG